MQGLTPHTISHNGVPVGLVVLPPDGERFTLPVQPLRAYAAIQSRVREASASLADVALGNPADASALHDAILLGRALELRDATGALVAVDYIELTDWPGGNPEVAAFIRVREVHAPVPAWVRPQPRGGSDMSGMGNGDPLDWRSIRTDVPPAPPSPMHHAPGA
jgi:hypothetical protein